MSGSQVSALVNPLTFRITRISIDSVLKERLSQFLLGLADELQDELSKASPSGRVSVIAETLARRLESDCLWASLPIRNTFPGFFSSLADYALSASSLGVCLSVQFIRENKEFESPDDAMKPFLRTEEEVIQFVRLVALLQTVFRYPGYSCEEAKETIVRFLQEVGLEDIAKPIALLSERISRTQSSPPKPSTTIEAVLTLASVISGTERLPLLLPTENFVEGLEWLQHQTVDREVITEVAEVLKSKTISNLSLSENAKRILPISEAQHSKCVEQFRSLTTYVKMDDRPISVLLLKAEGIQGIVKRTEALKGLVGFSALVELGIRKAAKTVARRLAGECIVYIGGGEFMALVPTSDHDELVQSATKEYREVVREAGTLKAPNPLSKMALHLHELVEGPDFAWQMKMTNPSDLTNRSFSRIYNLAKVLCDPVLNLPNGQNERRFNPGLRCSVCGVEEARESSRSPTMASDESLCPICEAAYKQRNIMLDVTRRTLKVKVNDGGVESVEEQEESSSMELPPDRIRQKASEVFCRRLEDRLRIDKDLASRLKGKTLSFAPTSSLDDLGSQMYKLVKPAGGNSEDYTPDSIAVVYGDGDDFGFLKASVPSLALYRQFSRDLQAIIEKSLGDALAEVLLKQVMLSKESGISFEFPFQVVYSGGDDFLLLMDSAAIMIFLSGLRKSLISQLGSRSDTMTPRASLRFVGLSLGIAIVKNKVPLYSALEAVDELLTHAKSYSKSSRSSYGTDITAAMQRFVSIPTTAEIEWRLRPQSGGIIPITLTAWPRTGKALFRKGGLISMVKNLLKADVRSGKLQRVLHDAETKLPEEVEYILYYKAARSEKEREEYRNLAHSFVVDNDRYAKYVFLDIIETMKIILDSPRLLPEVCS